MLLVIVGVLFETPDCFLPVGGQDFAVVACETLVDLGETCELGIWASNCYSNLEIYVRLPMFRR